MSLKFKSLYQALGRKVSHNKILVAVQRLTSMQLHIIQLRHGVSSLQGLLFNGAEDVP